jgi:hypothetical protein
LVRGKQASKIGRGHQGGLLSGGRAYIPNPLMVGRVVSLNREVEVVRRALHTNELLFPVNSSLQLEKWRDHIMNDVQPCMVKFWVTRGSSRLRFTWEVNRW